MKVVGWILGTLVLVALAALVALPVMAQGEQPQGESVSTLVELLTLLAGAGGGGLIAAFLVEKFPSYQKLPKEAKAWVFFGLVVGLPILARVLLQFVPAAAWAIIEPYWQTLAASLLAWATGTGVYIGVIKPAQLRSQ